MATEFLHLPKTPPHAPPARKRGPYAQAGTNHLGSLSHPCALQTQDTGSALCSLGKPSQTITGAEPKTGSKASLISTYDKRNYMTSRSGFQTSYTYKPPVWHCKLDTSLLIIHVMKQKL